MVKNYAYELIIEILRVTIKVGRKVFDLDLIRTRKNLICSQTLYCGLKRVNFQGNEGESFIDILRITSKAKMNSI